MSPVTSTACPNPKTWQAGTLTYTAGGLVALFLWLLLGDFSWSMRDRSVGPMAQWYLGQLKISRLLFGLLITSFPALIGLVLSPIISVKSDRLRSRWGRRIPYLLITTPIAALGMIGLGCTPLIAQWVHGHFPDQNKVLISLICFGVFWTVFEFATIASTSVFSGLVNDVVPEPLLGRFFGLFRAVSLLGGIGFNFWIMGYTPTHFTTILLVLGVFYGVSFLWVCSRIKEGKYPPSEAVSPRKNFCANAVGEVRLYCRECFNNSYYLVVFLLMMLGGVSSIPVNTFAIPYAESLGVSMAVFGNGLALVFTISLFLSYFLGWLCDIFHPLRMVIVVLIGYLVAMVYGCFYAKTADTFLIAWVAHGVLSGCYFTTVASLGQRLFPRAKFAQFASAAGIFSALVCTVAAPMMGVVIDLTNQGYWHVFTVGGIFTILALLLSIHVHQRFMRLGGPRHYTAPE
jgi:MFS family permease